VVGYFNTDNHSTTDDILCSLDVARIISHAIINDNRTSHCFVVLFGLRTDPKLDHDYVNVAEVSSILAAPNDQKQGSPPIVSH
jgi:hypothetical protein